MWSFYAMLYPPEMAEFHRWSNEICASDYKLCSGGETDKQTKHPRRGLLTYPLENDQMKTVADGILFSDISLMW